MTPLTLFAVVGLLTSRVQSLNKSHLENATEIKVLTKTLEIILQVYYTDAQYPTQISSLNSNPNLVYIQNDILNEILNGSSNELNLVFQLTNKRHHYPSFYNLAFIDDYKVFSKLLEELESDSFDASGFYTIVITQNGTVDEHLLSQIFSILWELGIVNTIILISDISKHSEVVEIYTYLPYGNENCGQVTPVLLYMVNQTFPGLSEVNLFPKRIRNFFNCTLRVGTLENRPYIIFETTEDGNSLTVKGFEANLVEILAKRLNFRPEYVAFTNATDWGTVGTHGGTGLLGMVQRKKVDFGIGCITYRNDRSMFLTAGILHYTSRIVFAIPDGRLYTSLEKLLRPFERSMWFAVGICFVLVAFVVIPIQLSPEKSNLLMDTVSAVFGNPMISIYERDSARVWVFTWIYYCFILRTVYQLLLFQYLRQEQRWPRVNSFEDIDREGLICYMLNGAERFFQDNPHILDKTIHLPYESDSLNKGLERLARNDKYGAMVVLLDNIAYHNNHKSEMGVIYAMDLTISLYPVGIHYPKNSPLTNEFNRIVNMLQPTGIIDYWAKSFGSYAFLKLIPADQNDLVPLSVSHLGGCFILLLLLHVVSLATFSCELVRSINLKK